MKMTTRQTVCGIGIGALLAAGLFVLTGAGSRPLSPQLTLQPAIENPQRTIATPPTAPEPEPDELLPAPMPGRVVDKVFSAREADLADFQRVIGVVVNGKARAYQATGMSQPDTHIAIDELNGQSIAVTYCDRTDSVRAFCGDPTVIRSLAVDGFEDGSLQLRAAGERFALDDGKPPLQDLEVTYTTWGEWLKRHPESDLYRGIYTNRMALPRKDG